MTCSLGVKIAAPAKWSSISVSLVSLNDPLFSPSLVFCSIFVCVHIESVTLREDEIHQRNDN